jgi:serine/threonine-protein kinase RsbW
VIEPPELDTIRPSHETAAKVPRTVRCVFPSSGRGGEKPLEKPRPGRLSFSLNSTMESVSEVEALAEKMAAESGLDEDEQFRLTMAVREAAVNAVLHGNEYDPTKKITAVFENTGKSLVVRISDEGKGVDAENLPDPTAPENILRGTGRGIFLIRSLMDEVHFRQLHPGTELTLVKHLAPAVEKT